MIDHLPATDVERAFFAYDRASPSNIVVATRLQGKIDPELLEQALNLARAEHPYLDFAFSSNGAFLLSRPTSKVRLSKSRSQEGWVRFCEEEMIRRIDMGTAPLVQATWFGDRQGGYLIVTFSHVDSDGMSCQQFVRKTLECLADLSVGKPAPQSARRQLRRPSSASFPSDLQSQPKLSLGDLDRDGFVIQTFAPETAPFVWKSSASQGDFRVRILPVDLEKKQTNELFDRCKRDGVTWNSRLCSALAFALRDYAESRSGLSTLWLKISSALDLRRRMTIDRPDLADMGMWAGRCTLYAEIRSAEVFSSFVSAYQTIFQACARQAPFQEVAALIASGGSSTTPADLRPQRPFFPQLKVTNMGDLEKSGFVQDYGSFLLESLHCLTPLHRGWTNDLGFGLIPSYFAGRLNLDFVWIEGVRDEEGARRLSTQVVDYILR